MGIKKIFSKQTKDNILDWFIIQRIRILNFIGEHKYVSAGIGIFLFSSVLGLIVYATNIDEYADKVQVQSSISTKSAASAENITSIKSFSTLIYEVNYKLDLKDIDITEIDTNSILRTVVIKASLKDKTLDANWVYSDDNTTYKVVKNDEENSITVTIPNVSIGNELTKQIYLNTKNIKDDTKLEVDFTVYESTATTEELKSKNISNIDVESKEVELTAKVIPTFAYKDKSYTSGKLVHYGILLGFEDSNITSLEGLYFNPNQNIDLYASQNISGSDVKTQIELDTDKTGVYDAKTAMNDKLPHYKSFDGYDYSVFDSGEIESLDKTASKPSGEIITNSSPKVYLVGPSKINLNLGETYTEYGISLSDGGSQICKTNNATCMITITNSENEVVTNVDTTKKDTYTISYKYISNNDFSSVKRIVIVNDEIKVTIDSDTYKLNGNSEITLLKNTTYTELGVLKNNSKVDASKIVIVDSSDEIVDTIDTTKTGTYKITYSLNEDNSKYLTRTVNVINSFEYKKIPEISASSLYYPVNGEVEELSIKVDSETIKCDDSNNCEVTYYDTQTGKKTTLDNSVTGSYEVEYTYTKDNYVLNVRNLIHFQTKYTLKIKNIKSDGIIVKDNNFVMLGSYYVTAKSPRENTEETILVTLETQNGTKTSSDTVNHYLNALGTKQNDLYLKQEVGGQEYTFNSNEFIAYGEEIILQSKFKYTLDGDNDIDNLNVTIPINGSFNILEYSSEVSENPYYIEMTGNDGAKTNVLYYVCTDEECKNTKLYEGTFADLSSDETLKLSAIKYTVDKVSPGTNIDFKIRLSKTIESDKTKTSVLINPTTIYNSNIQASTNSVSVNITPFKARTRIFIGNSEQDAIIDASNVNSSTFLIYPTFSMPALSVNTNLVDITSIDATVVVTLPKGLNYVFNEAYDTPVVSKNGSTGVTTLTYYLKNKPLNDWVDPITLEASYDIDIPLSTVKEIKAVISASASNNSKIVDLSMESSRTTTRNITYMNVDEISYGQYASNTTVTKDSAFSITTKIYNNDVDKNYTNLEIVTILPYNDVENEKNNFVGTYTISNLNENLLCTTTAHALLSTSNNFLNDDVITWKSCNEFKNINYEGVTAIKLSNISLKTNELASNTFTITAKNNKSGNVYKVNSYLVRKDTGSVKTIPSVSVEVISKKISGLVWEELDSNGLMDQEEGKVSGVLLKLYDASNDKLVQEVVTDDTGKYSFQELQIGKYYIVAEYNTVKYGLSPFNVINDKTITSAFSAIKNEEDEKITTTRTDVIEIKDTTNSINNVNLGLSIKKIYTVKINKYINKVITTNALGVSTTKEFGNVKLAKIDVKDISNVSLKVLYTIEVENTGYFPGYVTLVEDFIPDGMSFNEEYEENKGWILNKDGYLENRSLSNELIESGSKKYLTLMLEITRKEAGSFINYASISDDSLEILNVFDASKGGNN